MRKFKQLVLTARLLVVAPLLLLLGTGYTDCQSFTDVTVPASDTDAPTTYDGVWVGEYIRAALTGSSFTYHLAPGETVQAVSSAIDSGGLKKLKTFTGSSCSCCSGSVCSLTQPLSAPQTDEQAGEVGSTVSNGLWLYSTVGLPTCPSGFTLRSFHYSWWTEAEDFYGHRTTGNVQSIVYP